MLLSMPRSGRPIRTRIQTEALLVRKAPFGDADVMVTLFTEARGIVSAVARSALRSTKRFPSLEPMHLLRVGLEERSGQDLAVLTEASLVRPRLALTSDLDRLEAAGRALRWVRRAAPPHTPEPELWAEVNALLDALDAPLGPAAAGDPPPVVRVAGMGLRMLASIGWALDFERCVRCGRPCDPGASAYVDAAEGGLVCRSCGGSVARVLLRDGRRERFLRAAQGDDAALDAGDARVAMDLVDAALEAHST
jgi:DNA repair protein RecO (recombination protein O)